MLPETPPCSNATQSWIEGSHKRSRNSAIKKSKVVEEVDKKTVARRTVPSTVEAMLHDGRNKMTEVLQISVESNQTADIFDIAQIRQKDEVQIRLC